MRRSFAGLADCARQVMQRDPASGALFLFAGKRGHSLKVLWWDKTGYYCILYNQPSSYCTSFGSRSVSWRLVLWSARGSGAIHEPVPSAAVLLG
jgi:IS66 Orf2 like protein